MRHAFKSAVAAGLLVGVALSFTPPIFAARNSSGTYSLPTGNPVVSRTAITTTWANTTLADIGSELTNSLDRQGRGAMAAPLKLSNGTSSAPGLTFNSETTSGLYRAGSNDIRMQIGGEQKQRWTASGAMFPIMAYFENGGTFTNSLDNSGAIVATGNGTAAAIYGTGGLTNGDGADLQGRGTGAGVRGVGGSGGGPGARLTGSSTGAGAVLTPGTTSTAADPTNAATLVSGNLNFSPAVNPNTDEGFSNTLTPKNTAKAWGNITTDASGGLTINNGFNIGTAVVTDAQTITVDIQTDLANAFCAGSASIDTDHYCNAICTGIGTVKLFCNSFGGTPGFTTTTKNVSFMVFGVQ
jgi:hypothetical protein